MNFIEYYRKENINLMMSFANMHPEDYPTDESYGEMEQTDEFQTYIRDEYIKYLGM